MENYLENLAFKVGAPTMLLTENHRSKFIRVIGVCGVFILFPLSFLGFVILMLATIVGLYNEI